MNKKKNNVHWFGIFFYECQNLWAIFERICLLILIHNFFLCKIHCGYERSFFLRLVPIAIGCSHIFGIQTYGGHLYMPWPSHNRFKNCFINKIRQFCRFCFDYKCCRYKLFELFQNDEMVSHRALFHLSRWDFAFSFCGVVAIDFGWSL